MMAMMKAAAQQQGSSPFNDDYRDACIASGAVGLWMLDETTGTTAVDQGTAGVDGTYYGQLATSASRGVRSAFNIPLAGCSATNSGTAGNGFLGGVVAVPGSYHFTTTMGVIGGAISYEWVSVKDYDVAADAYWFRHYGPSQYIKEDNDNSTSQCWFWYNDWYTSSRQIVTGTVPKQTVGVATHNVLTISSASDYIFWWRNGVRTIARGWPYIESLYGGGASIRIGNRDTSSSYWATYGARGAIGGVAIYDYEINYNHVMAHYNALQT